MQKKRANKAVEENNNSQQTNAKQKCKTKRSRTRSRILENRTDNIKQKGIKTKQMKQKK